MEEEEGEEGDEASLFLHEDEAVEPTSVFAGWGNAVDLEGSEAADDE